MSLINQMLQELDSRRGETNGVSAYGTHIRAVPERRGIHAAWWVALALAIMLAGVVAWVLTRPTQAPVATVPQAQLPLRMSADIDLSQSAMRTPAQTAAASAPVPPIPAAQVPNVALASEASPADAGSLPGKSRPDGKQVAPAQSKSLSVTDTNTNTSQSGAVVSPTMDAAVKTPPVTDPQKVVDVVAAVAAQKQVRELTVQQRAENEYRKATLLMQQGRQDEAIGTLEQALQLDGHHTAARQALISLLLDAKRQDEAMGKAREGLKLDSAQTGLAMILARLQLEKGDLKPAIETLERSQMHATEKTDYQSFLAALLQRDNRNREAAELYLRVLQRAPQNGVWWMGLGISLQAESRFSEAQEAFSRAKASSNLSPELMAFVESRLKQLQR